MNIIIIINNYYYNIYKKYYNVNAFYDSPITTVSAQNLLYC